MAERMVAVNEEAVETWRAARDAVAQAAQGEASAESANA